MAQIVPVTGALITESYWPLVILLIAFFLKRPISNVLKERKLRLTLPNDISFSISSDVAEKTLTQLFIEFYLTYNRLLKPWHKALFNKILAAKKELKVGELIEGFDHSNKDHIGALRALRGLGLIEPRNGGSWSTQSVIEISSFGQIFVKYLNMREKSIQHEASEDS